LTNRYSSTWKVRAKTFQAFKKDVRKEYSHSSIRILDLGAGNCWLSYRLAQQGYTVTAVDINIDSNDGLAVAQKLMRSGSVHFRCVRAEFDFLPFPARSFDVIIFNASLHYSSAPVQTIQRTLPLLNGQGTIYILDSPLYKNPESGKAMVNERLELYRSTFGLQRPERPTQSFLTFGQLEEIRSFANVTTLQPAYGLLWKARRLFAMRFKRREPATFLILKIKRQ
jgi:SAM-dependent methyltransferase